MKNVRFFVFCLFWAPGRVSECETGRQREGDREAKEGQRVGNGRREREREKERDYIY